MPNVDAAKVEELKAEILKPLDLFAAASGASPAIRTSTPNYIKPKMFMFRLQKIMDEYAGGVTASSRPTKPS